MAKVTVASKTFSDLGEGPHWDEKSQTLLYVDAFVGDICRLNPITQETDSIHFDNSTVTFVIPFEFNARQLVISKGNEIRRLHWDTRESVVLTVPEKDIPGNRFNDAKCDTQGRLWAGTLSDKGEKEKGSLYSIDSNLQIRKHTNATTVSNGITWSTDNKTLFFNDSDPRKIYAFDYDASDGSTSNQRVFLDFNKHVTYQDCGFPDGMTTDINGKLWVTCFAGGRVLCIDPETGTLLRVIHFPAQKTTSCCFGGPNYSELYVTSAYKDLSDKERKEQPTAGAVYKVTNLDTKGFPAKNFAAPF